MMQVISMHESPINIQNKPCMTKRLLLLKYLFTERGFTDTAVAATLVCFCECAVAYNMGTRRQQQKHDGYLRLDDDCVFGLQRIGKILG